MTFANKSSVAPAPSRHSVPAAVVSDLRIGKPDDSYEREADRAANDVMSGDSIKCHWSLSSLGRGTTIQRKCACGGSAHAEGECADCKEERQGGTLQRKAAGAAGRGTAPPIVHDVLRSPGQPLDRATRDFFEPRFGYNFGGVRVHTDAKAAQSARAVNAEAYAVGEDLVFTSTSFRPETAGGRRLLAHELAHVVQNVAGPPSPSPGASASLRRQVKGDPFGLAATKPSAYDTAGMIARGGTSLQKSVETSHWRSEEEKIHFIRSYIRYAKDHGLSKQYDDAVAAYPAFAPESSAERTAPVPSSSAPKSTAVPDAAGRKAPPAIARLPYVERPVPSVQFLRLGFLGMEGLLTVQPHQPWIQKGPDPTAGYNFDTYLVNMSGGAPVAAQWLGGTRYRVLMGTPECPGCHFGRGLEIDLQGEHPLFIAGTMALQAAPVVADMMAARAMVTQEAALVTQGKGAASRPGNSVPSANGKGTARLDVGSKTSGAVAATEETAGATSQAGAAKGIGPRYATLEEVESLIKGGQLRSKAHVLGVIVKDKAGKILDIWYEVSELAVGTEVQPLLGHTEQKALSRIGAMKLKAGSTVEFVGSLQPCNLRAGCSTRMTQFAQETGIDVRYRHVYGENGTTIHDFTPGEGRITKGMRENWKQ